ncbi:MAG: outer membrane protein assembly factor BamA [Alphaproteobacteria bacterium]
MFATVTQAVRKRFSDRRSAVATLSVASVIAAALPFAAIGQEQGLPTRASVPVVGVTQVAQLSGDRISEVRIEGAQRIEPETVLSYMVAQPGDRFNSAAVDRSLKALFATGLFADIRLRREADVLVVEVTENPIINRIAFEGNERIKDDELGAETALRERVVYTRTRVQSDVDRLLDIYRRSGYFAATVEPKVIQLPQNRIDLVFEINEGTPTRVARVAFIGNRAFSDTALRGEIATAETRWYKFLTATDTYDPDRVEFDKELLRKFYLENGYADFRVVSGVAELSEDGEDFFITFTLEEGERYKFGTVELSASLPGVEIEPLEEMLTFEEGDWYDSRQIERSINELTKGVLAQQHPFVTIRPRLQRRDDAEEKVIDVAFEIAKSGKTYIERIDIVGNVRTLDRVIRREIQMIEGDPLNAEKIADSRDRIRGLGYFEKVEVTQSPGSAADQVVVTVTVVEQSTGELSVGAGFSSTDGPLADFGIRERNFLGRGQELAVKATLSGKTQEFDVSFTEPWFMSRDVSLGVDAFHITRDLQDESNYDQLDTGGALRLGYSLTENLRQSLSYRFNRVEITNVGSSASRAIREAEGVEHLSQISQTLSYDRRNSRVEPTGGYILTLSNDLSGLGGSKHFIRTRASGTIYHQLFEDWVASATAEAGFIDDYTDKSVSITDRFSLGGSRLRGFAPSGIGPRDLITDDALGGNAFYRGSVELTFPMPLIPEELGFKGAVFADAGSLWVADDDGADVIDDHSIRAAVGVGVGWRSPFGPIRLDFAAPVLKEEYDDIEKFRFNFGTRF